VRQGAASLVLAAVVVLMGLLLVARTIALGVGGGLGLLIGALFILGGGLRIYLGVVTWRNR
jgi:hypothetical protein